MTTTAAEGYGVVFDMDGVLVDSFQAHFTTWRDYAATQGFVLTRDQFLKGFGRTAREAIVQYWPELKNQPALVAKMDREKEQLYRDLLARSFPAMDGAKELIRSLHEAGIRVAIGSSGPVENVECVIDQLGSRQFLTAAISGNDVDRGKPDPQIFLKAIAAIGLNPNRCCVVEDAPVGLAAAHAAGATCVGLISDGHADDEMLGAELVVRKLTDLNPEVIRKIIDRGRNSP